MIGFLGVVVSGVIVLNIQPIQPQPFLCRTTPGEWLMDANKKTDRPPEQIVREVSPESLSTEFGLVSLENVRAEL